MTVLRLFYVILKNRNQNYPQLMRNIFSYKDDAQMVTEVIAGNQGAIRYMFYDQYKEMLRHNAQKAAGTKQVSLDDLTQELFLYLSADDWRRLRTYTPPLPFASWFTVVSYRFFKDFTHSMIENTSIVPIDTIEEGREGGATFGVLNTLLMDVKKALEHFRPPRDKQILEALLLREEDPQQVADTHQVTIDNLYNIKRRALARLIREHLQSYQTRIA